MYCPSDVHRSRPRFDSWWHHNKKEIHSGLFFVPAGIQTGGLRRKGTIIAKAIFLAARARLLPEPFSPPLRSVDYCQSHFLSRKGNDYFGRNRRRKNLPAQRWSRQESDRSSYRGIERASVDRPSLVDAIS